jgi:hypothetical protein
MQVRPDFSLGFYLDGVRRFALCWHLGGGLPGPQRILRAQSPWHVAETWPLRTQTVMGAVCVALKTRSVNPSFPSRILLFKLEISGIAVFTFTLSKLPRDPRSSSHDSPSTFRTDINSAERHIRLTAYIPCLYVYTHTTSNYFSMAAHQSHCGQLP